MTELFSKNKELAFIAAILNNNLYLNYPVCQLPTEVFYLESNRRLWAEVMRQYAEALWLEVDLTEHNYLSALHMPEEAKRENIDILLTWNGLLMEWFENEEYRAAWPTTLAQQLRELYYKRSLYDSTQLGLSGIQGQSAAEVASKLAASVHEALNAIHAGDTLAQPTVADLWEGVQYLSTGFAKIDNASRGLVSPGMTVLGARVSMGKTALARAIVRSLLFSGHNVFWYAKDQHPKQLFEIEVAQANGMTLDQYRAARNDPKKRQSIVDNAVAVTESWKQHLTTTSKNLDIDELYALIASQHVQKRFKVVVIDHMQLVGASKARGSYEKVTYVSNQLKSLALDLGVAVLALAQLGRGAAENKRPTMTDLKNSGDIEQDADQIWLLHRPMYYEVREGRAPEVEESAQLFIDKDKLGSVSKADLVFTPKFIDFSDFGNLGRHVS